MNKPEPLFIYLACPYSSDDPAEVLQRFHRVNKAAGELMDMGYVVFSPITHSHTIESAMERVKPWAYWRIQDLNILKRCDKIIVLMLPGWKESTGVTEEIQFAREIGTTVCYLDPKALEV